MGLIEELVDLLPVLVGGGLAVAGGLAGDWWHHRREVLSLQRAIVAEIAATLHLVEQRGFVRGLEAWIERAKLGQENESFWWSFNLRHDPFRVYHANLSRIGLLSPSLAYAVTTFYTLGTSFLEDVADMREGRLGKAGRDASVARLTEMAAVFEEARRAGRCVIDLAK